MDGNVAMAVGLTLKVAAAATAFAFLPACALAYALARFRFPGRAVISAVAGLPLVVPPTAVGFLLLRLLAADGPLGRDVLGFDPHLLLTWRGAVVATAVVSFPLVVRTARVTFESIDPRYALIARTLGSTPLRAFVRHTLPLATRGLAAAAILGFTRALGEFGATIVVAGSIPGETQTLASAIFAAQQAGHDAEAYALVLIALGVGLVAILASELLSTRSKA
jgi:molybdate transport system permease protein